jgi:hypothetical protein
LSAKREELGQENKKVEKSYYFILNIKFSRRKRNIYKESKKNQCQKGKSCKNEKKMKNIVNSFGVGRRQKINIFTIFFLIFLIFG